jgi:putative Mg2+ transporter-C (MgtC) family protein
MTIEEDVLKILLSVLAGGLIGAEREYRDKAAGFRTLIFICMGATLFTILSIRMGEGIDPARIAAAIVSGVGFLGAGVILRHRGQILGLTTASTIWLAAAVGMGIGGGYYLQTGAAVLTVMIVLWFFPFIEWLIDNLAHTVRYKVTSAINPEKPEQLLTLAKELRLRVKNFKKTKSGDTMTLQWEARGSPKKHNKLVEVLFADPEITDFQL